MKHTLQSSAAGRYHSADPCRFMLAEDGLRKYRVMLSLWPMEI